MTIQDFISKVGERAGVVIDLTKPELAGIATLNNVLIPDTIVNGIMEGTLTVDTAPHHKGVRNKIWAESLNGVDAILNKYFDSLDLSAEERQTITAEKDTFKRMGLLNDVAKTKVEALKAAKPNGKDDERSKALEEQNKKLIADIKLAQDNFATEKQSIVAANENQLTSMFAQQMLASYKMALPEEMPLAVKNKLALDVINAKLSTDGYIMKLAEGNLEVFTKEGTKALAKDNSVITPKSYFESVLAENKLLDLTGGSQNGGGQQQQQSAAQQQQRQFTPSGGTQGNSSFQAALEASIKEVQAEA